MAASATSRGQRAVPRSRREDLIAEVASLYYQDRLDQEEVARRVGVSRSTVSRMLTEALETGVVEIRIRRALPLDEQLQRDLSAAFGLRDALVLSTHGRTSDPLPRVGRLAGRYLDAVVGEGDVLAISWGTAVRAVADGLDPRSTRHVDVVQMLGGGGSGDVEVDGTELARRLAGLLGGRCRYLNVPLVVDDEKVAAALLRQRSVRQTLAAAANADVALVGIGALVPSVSSLLRAGHLDRRGIVELRRLGAVGDVCGRLFTVDGDPVDADLARRIVSVDTDTLRKIPRVVGVACGAGKTEAILGAVRGGLVTVLVTDDTTAREVLARAGNTPPTR